MARRRLHYGVIAAVAVGAAPAWASPDERRQVDVRGGRLSAALSEFARETGTELLFDQELVGRLTVPPLRGSLSRRDALSRLLDGTGLGFREAGGAFVLFRSAVPADPGIADDPPVPDILVIGRRTQNADIRRTRNDIQPYRLIGRREIGSAHRDNIEQLIRSREPLNVEAVSPSQSTAGGDTRSSFDFRGLGSVRSLVLVDGRRLPAHPTDEFDFGQPDLNGIPLGAVDRIETRTGTAGGIYGPGALGGVLNIVLRRDYRGAELRMASGVTSRGDSRILSIDGGIGFSPDDGRTEVMLAAGHRRTEPLLQGSRDFSLRQRRLQFANSPSDYASLTPSVNAILVFSGGGEDLVFDAQYGGGSVGSPVSFLPLGFSGTPEEARQLLRQNAGRTIFELASAAGGSPQHVTATPTVTSVIGNIRHRISSSVEFYADGLLLHNAGRQTTGPFGLRVTLADAPTNPFNQVVRFTFPTAPAPGRAKRQSRVIRVSAGVVVRLPDGWSVSGDYTSGRATATRDVRFSVGSDELQAGLQLGTPRADGTIVDPLGPWEALKAALAAYTASGSSTARVENRFADATLRLAGPIARLRGGHLTGTLLLERRREDIPDSVIVDRFSMPERTRERKLFERSQIVSSVYGEIRAPLTGEQHILRDFQIQLALRYDRSVSTIPNGVGGSTLTAEERPRRSGREAITYTAGAQFHALPRLMLRASLATGELPPSLAGLRAGALNLGRGSPFSTAPLADYPDPQRGGRPVGSERLVRVLLGGMANAPPERARTLAVGAVLNPEGRSGPRVSVDYTRISLFRQPNVTTFDLSRHWDLLPGLLAGRDSRRLVRAPLTEGDRALGFTGGIVTQADVRGLLHGSSVIEAVDIELDWTVPAGALGSLRIYGRGTWQPTLRRRVAQAAAWYDDAGDLDGPLAWRGHGGIEWARGETTIGLNAQYFGRYRAAYGSFGTENNAQIRRFQGSDRIPSQTYFDLSFRHRFSRALEFSAGVINLFDRSPPIVAERFNIFGYSFYGDPRRRRFEVSALTNF